MMRRRLRQDLIDLMMTPGLSGHEERVAALVRARLSQAGVASRVDRMGNVIASLAGNPDAPSVMIFTHMDQLGFFVRRIEADGLIRVERMGGVSERAMAAQVVTLCIGEGRDVTGIIINKAHHATGPDEKYKVVTAPDILIDTGHGDKEAVEAAGIRIGTPVVYQSRVIELAGDRIAGPSVDDRAGCAALLEIARGLIERSGGPTVHVVFSVQEEFNLRGALVAAQALKPDIAIQIDLMLATDTPDMAERGEMKLGGGPGISLYSFHGRGTLNGVIPHPSMVTLFEQTAERLGMPLQRSAQVGVLTDLSYVQLVGEGVASIDIGFPMRHSHSTVECCDLADVEAMAKLALAAISGIGADFKLTREI
ncbi:M42 family metallopeptidase [Hoeflea sp. YIM 152468]|uniref:M42 family metallopeptidase n=1 Tax=Hoeflea sp. YIM 152468 TaxID=3031759 RepID=UPI0023DC958F|nr:M42 family metallopeptidase [Hoeflea sp. YIM 152468]MDF1606855.1 M42 family metallopeptidase [Hoeflea sp. YIM 152468]